LIIGAQDFPILCPPVEFAVPSRLWHLYLLECVDGSLYTGVTIDVAARLIAHQTGKGARYTRSHKPMHLLASAPVGTKSEALKAELVIKRLPRDQMLPAVQSLASQNSYNSESPSSMNKSELIEAIAQSAELTKADAERTLNATIETVVKTVAKGDTVTLVGFGTFKSVKRAARTGRNPATGAALKIAASTSPKFTAGATFKAAVAGKNAKKK
jgi:DNA-binding protein HU-beta